MRVIVFQERTGSGLGGADMVSATAAEVLSAQHEVHYVHQKPGITKSDVERFFRVDLGNVNFRYLEFRENCWHDKSSRWWRLWTVIKRLSAPFSDGCDLFFASVHGLPPACLAPRGAVYLHFPVERRPSTWAEPAHSWKQGVRNHARKLVFDRVWERSLASYSVRFANSHFTRGWTESMWGGNWEVLYPPSGLDEQPRVKRNLVASLARFAPGKGQLEIVEAFNRLVAPALPGWCFVGMGGLAPITVEEAYFHEVQLAANRPELRLAPNLPREEVVELLGEAKIFWHAVGWGVDESVQPHRAEHFGISTVEAMSMGSVPVVLARGGQREIVEHGVSGFLCETFEDMAAATFRLATDEGLWRRMSQAARERAKLFERKAFARRLNALAS